MKAVHAEEKRRRETLEADLAKLNQRLTSANIGLTMAQAAAKMEKLPMAICNSETKRDPEPRKSLDDNIRAQSEFNSRYNKRYKNPDLTDTWKHAAYQDAKELHYPECWDTAAYPTLEEALLEALHNFECSAYLDGDDHCCKMKKDGE